MALTYIQAPIPKWLFTDASGNILAGGTLTPTRSSDPNTAKTVYALPGGVDPYPAIITFDGAGMAGPFYWELDSANPSELYYLTVKDSNGVVVFTINDYPTVGTSSGSVTTALRDSTNYIVNNVFDHSVVNGSTALNVSSLTNVILAPGNHQGFSLPTSLLYGGDFRFVKSNTSATDSITFPAFTLGLNELSPDLTPTNYFRLQCTGVGAGETYKRLQIAINKDVQNFSGEEVTFTYWGKSDGANKQVTVNFLQFFGDGTAASAAVSTAVMADTLTTSWVKYTATVTIATVAGKTIGECGNSQLFLNFNFPTNAAFDTSIAKPAMFLGSSSPTEEYQDSDYVAAIVDAPRTGDIRMSMNSFAPFGWVPMNDGTIGADSSLGATASSASTRANLDTFPLYDLIWNTYANSLAPVYTSLSVPTTRGASSEADFQAGVQLQLTRVLGRVLAGAWGGSNDIGSAVTSSSTTISSVDTATDRITLASGTVFYTGIPLELTTTGTLPAPLVAGTVYYAVKISANVITLYPTAADAIAGTNIINLTTGGTGTNTVITPPYTLGETQGNYTHTLTSAQLPNPLTEGATGGNAGGAGIYPTFQSGSSASNIRIDNANGGNAHNIIQNTAFMNIFAKL